MVEEKLQRQDLFALLTPKEVEVLSDASGVVSLKKGEKCTRRGFQQATSLYSLRAGSS